MLIKFTPIWLSTDFPDVNAGHFITLVYVQLIFPTRSYYRKETAASAFHISQHDNTARAHLNQ